MKLLICDNEEECVKDVDRHVRQFLFEHGTEAEICMCYSSNEAMENIDYYDIAFLDVEMDGENGLYIGKQLQEINPQIVLIYITAYDHYLDDALDLGTTRFFKKPINSQRFYKGLERAISKLDNTEIKFYLQSNDNGTETIKISDIIYVEIIGRKTKIVSKNKSLYSNENIKSWKDKLSKSYFISPHNSFIVNTNYITYFQKDHIILDGKYYVPIAYKKRSEFKRKFMLLMGD